MLDSKKLKEKIYENNRNRKTDEEDKIFSKNKKGRK